VAVGETLPFSIFLSTPKIIEFTDLVHNFIEADKQESLGQLLRSYPHSHNIIAIDVQHQNIAYEERRR
jgi:hypothetical protein